MLAIDQATKDRVRWYLKYEENDYSGDLYAMFRDWWHKRRGVAKWEFDGEKYWHQKWIAMVNHERRKLKIRRGSRCPTCGAKLTVMSCLACDLKAGVLQ
jgi:hypothetical protein